MRRSVDLDRVLARERALEALQRIHQRNSGFDEFAADEEEVVIDLVSYEEKWLEFMNS